MYVVDASIVIAWLIPEKHSKAAAEALTTARLTGIYAPVHFQFEVANALWAKMRRGVIDGAFRDQALAQVDALAIERDFEARRLPAIVTLSDRYGLTIYDAANLEVAIRLGASLVTLDQELRAAALLMGVDLRPS